MSRGRHQVFPRVPTASVMPDHPATSPPAIVSVDRLKLERFTAFEEVELDLCAGFNVLVGENGTGKTHLLKLLYSVLRTVHDASRDGVPTKRVLEDSVADKLLGVFRPDQLGRLVRRAVGRRKAKVQCHWQLAEGQPSGISFEFSNQAQRQVSVSRVPKRAGSSVIFLPSREVLSFYPGFAASYERRELEFDETYYDLCRALEATPLKRGRRGSEIGELAERLEKRLGARVRLEEGKFRVRFDEGNDLEAHLVAEGLRKLTTVLYLVLNGSLSRSSVLFWDEPEANLNPRYVSLVVEVLRTLVESGVQVFLATHDYLVSQKLSLLAQRNGDEKALPIRFFLLGRDPESTDGVTVTAGDSMAAFPDDPILDEFARQYDEELDTTLD